MTPTDDIDRNWTGSMLEYTECDFPGATPYQRQIPGWQCNHCGQQYGTSGPPPKYCRCELKTHVYEPGQGWGQ